MTFRRRIIWTSVAIAVVLTISMLSTLNAQAQAPNGTVYIESNIGHVEGQNSILAFHRDAVGHLTPIGSYPTGVTGAHPLFIVSQQALLGMPPDSNELHVLRLAADGTIAAQTDRVVIPVSPSLPQGIAAR